MSAQKIKMLGVMDEDPFDYKTWSGSSIYFFNALKSNNCLYEAISAQPPHYITYAYKCLNIQSNIAKWKFKYHLDTHYYKQMTRTVLSKIEQMDENEFNVILQIGGWYDLTRRKDKITISYHDGNLATLLKSPYGYPPINERHIKNALDYEKQLYKKMDFLFPMSRWLADSFINDFGVDSKKIIPVGVGINLPRIKEIKDKRYNEPNILFIGKNFDRKGGRHLLEAFKIVRKEIKNATLTIIGPDLNDDVSEGVRSLGFVSKDSAEGINLMLSEYASASIFVMPSLYEPFGIVFAEAMAHKLPCIGTDICAMPEIIDDGVNGYVVPPADSKLLAQRMISLLKEPETCREMGERAYDKYLNNYTWDTVIKKIIRSVQERI